MEGIGIPELAEQLSDKEIVEILRLKTEYHKNQYLAFEQLYLEATGGKPKTRRKKRAGTAPKTRRGRKPKAPESQDAAGSPDKPIKRRGRPAGSKSRKKAVQNTAK